MSAEPKPTTPRDRPHWIIWLFAIVGLLGIIALIVLTVTIFGAMRSGEPPEIVAANSETHFVLREAVPMPGTTLVQIVIAAGPAGSPYSSGGRMGDTRNILLLDRTTGAVRRLLPDNNRRIARSYFLPAQAEAAAESSDEIAAPRDTATGTPPVPPAYFALLVGQPGTDDRFDLLIGRLADDGPVFVMPGLAGVDGIWMQSPTQMAVLAREGLNLFYRIVDIPSRRVILSRRIEI